MIINNKHDEHDDDVIIGRVLSRREMLGLLAGAGTILLAGCGDPTATAQPATTAASQQATATTVAATSTSQPTKAAATATNQSTTVAATTAAATSTSQPTTAVATQAAAANAGTLPSCVVVPALTEGPYFVDEKLNRSDIRPDPSNNSVSAGTPLRLAFNVSQIAGGACTAYAGAIVDIWHCDANGLYSDEQANNTVGKKFLRGYQVADANGKVEFLTIYPGWYQGRAVHIHFKIRSALNSAQATTFTSQLFFDETINDQVLAQAPYSARQGQRLKNSGDGIYQQGGKQLLLNLVKEGNGYAATFNVGLQKV